MAAIHDLTAIELAAALRAGTVSSAEAVRHALGRIAAVDPGVGAFVAVDAGGALRAAAEADRVLAEASRSGSGTDLPPLLGVPVGVKDLTRAVGLPCRYGSALVDDTPAVVDDHVVTLLRRAGAVVVGKTATPEFGLPCYTESDVAPPTRTPWDPARTAGGSSGGAAAAVAAGLVPLAQGSDGGGSIRIPASCCGLVGVKPTRGRVSNGPLMGDLTGLAWNGPLARTVADAALLLDVLAVPMPGDPAAQPAPPTPYAEVVRHDPPPLRVGRFATPVIADTTVHPECLRAWEDASRLLADLGHEVSDVTLPVGPGDVGAFRAVWAGGTTLLPVGPGDEERLRPLTRWLWEQGRATSARDYLAGLAGIQALARRVAEATTAYDVLLCPTLADLPVPVGHFTAGGDPAADFARQERFTPFTSLFNMTGQPAVSLPLHQSEGGLPVGVMLAAPYGRDDLLLALAAQVERAAPWRERVPPCWSSGSGGGSGFGTVER